jgi:hypothetical protein
MKEKVIKMSEETQKGRFLDFKGNPIQAGFYFENFRGDLNFYYLIEQSSDRCWSAIWNAGGLALWDLNSQQLSQLERITNPEKFAYMLKKTSDWMKSVKTFLAQSQPSCTNPLMKYRFSDEKKPIVT